MKIFPHREGEVAMKNLTQRSGRMKIFKIPPRYLERFVVPFLRWVGFLRPTQYSDLLSETFIRGPYHRLLFCWCRFSLCHSEFSSESFSLLSSFQQILKQVQDDGWTVGWRTFGPTLRTDVFHTQQILHHTCPHVPETLDCWRMTSITYGVGEKLPHKTPPYIFLGNKNENSDSSQPPSNIFKQEKKSIGPFWSFVVVFPYFYLVLKISRGVRKSYVLK